MKQLTKIIISLLIALLSGSILAADASNSALSLDDLIGRTFSVLSEKNVVSGGRVGYTLTIWTAAVSGPVNVPNGKTAAAGSRIETNMVPMDDGIVLHFYGPIDSNSPVQKRWMDFHNKDERSFEVVVGLPDQKSFVGVVGNYGPHFDIALLEKLFFFAPIPPRK